jgi:hypothetical protein
MKLKVCGSRISERPLEQDSATMTNTGSRPGSAVEREATSPSSLRRFPASGRLSLVIALTVLFLLPTGRVGAQEANEYEVKAAYLYNFARFVEWPDNVRLDPHGPLVIAILGKDPFGGEIDRFIEGKTVNGRRLVIKRFSSLEAYEQCHILFVSSSEKRNLPRILALVRSSSVLTVSETDRFAQIGGIINFITIENSIRFEINQAAAERVGLKISYKLLSLGRVVRT